MNPNSNILHNLKIIGKITAIVLLITTLLLCATGFLLYQFRFSDKTLHICVIAIYIISNFIGGLLVGKVQKEHKFIWGLSCGISYFFLLLFCSLILTQTLTSIESAIIAFLCCTLSSMFGGMLA